jgi:hypothetical protein
MRQRPGLQSSHGGVLQQTAELGRVLTIYVPSVTRCCSTRGLMRCRSFTSSCPGFMAALCSTHGLMRCPVILSPSVWVHGGKSCLPLNLGTVMR